MDSLWVGLTRLARAAILAGSALLFIAALIVTAEVLTRKAIPDLINLAAWLSAGRLASWALTAKLWIRDTLTFSGSDEISGYLFAIGTSWSLAYILVTRGHVRIDALYGRLGPRVRAALDVVALALLAVFAAALVERAYHLTMTNLVEYNRSNTNLRIPFAWSQVPWLAGMVLFFITITVAILRSLGAILRGDFASVNAIAGASTQDDEIESELKGLGIETAHEAKR